MNQRGCYRKLRIALTKQGAIEQKLKKNKKKINSTEIILHKF